MGLQNKNGVLTVSDYCDAMKVADYHTDAVRGRARPCSTTFDFFAAMLLATKGHILVNNPVELRYTFQAFALQAMQAQPSLPLDARTNHIYNGLVADVKNVHLGHV